MLALHRGERELGRATLEKSLAVSRAVANQVGVAMTLNNLGYLFHEHKDCLAAACAYAESAAAYRHLGDRLNLAAGLRDQGFALLAQGDVLAASTLCEESLAAARDLEDATAIASSSLDLALVRLHQQDWDSAQALLLDSLRTSVVRMGTNIDDARVLFCLAGLARVAAAQGNQERLELQAELLASPVDAGQLAELANPTLVGLRRIPGLKLHDDRVIRLLETLLNPGGFVAEWTTRELQARILARYRLGDAHYRLSQLRYDLSKLRAKGFIERLGRSRRYRLTPLGPSSGYCWLISPRSTTWWTMTSPTSGSGVAVAERAYATSLPSGAPPSPT
jgi:hypothetical protein